MDNANKKTYQSEPIWGRVACEYVESNVNNREPTTERKQHTGIGH